jgi:hypothetical protein
MAHYGADVSAWLWVNQTLRPGERLATYENMVYYILDSRPEYFYYLDGWEARALYENENPDEIVAALQADGVRYVLDPLWIHRWDMYAALPMNRYLGWPEYFPLVFTTRSAKVYQVGILEDPITRHSAIPVNLSPTGWSGLERVDNRLVKRLPVQDEAARVFVAGEGPITLRLTYLDKGNGYVAINLLSADGSWLYDFREIDLQDTKEWRTEVILLATLDVPDLVEIGLYSQEEDLYVSHIEAERLSAP